LDEIGELPLSIQAKFLRVLQEKQFNRVGLSKDIKSDFRLISATNRDLPKLIDSNEFRDDLYYRLKVVQIDVPPLRERKDDIPRLARLVISNKCIQMSRKTPTMSPETQNLLLSYNWPGNVRELENVIECTLIFCKKDVIDPIDIKGIDLAGHSELPEYETGKRKVLDKYQREYVQLALDIYEGNISKTAESMGLSRQGLYNLMKKYDINR
jgi:transcriptional regulator with PAS, ATPase and Fis domain